jgi:anti-sigma factor RsiW
MTCDETEVLVHALADGELDAGNARNVEAHVATCPRCARRLREVRELRAALAAGTLKFEAPASLRSRIEASAPASVAAPRAAVRTSRRSLLQGFAAGTALSSAVAASVVVMLLRGQDQQRLVNDAVAAHLRSLQAEHLTDVLSTDQHTVKPWFDGVLDYSPPAYDFSGKDFPLIGGRLDYIADRPVAALVYGRRKHFITLLVWPAERDMPVSISSRSQQGYHQLHWKTAEYSYWAVSDLGAAELGDFAGLVRQADSAAGATKQ